MLSHVQRHSERRFAWLLDQLRCVVPKLPKADPGACLAKCLEVSKSMWALKREAMSEEGKGGVTAATSARFRRAVKAAKQAKEREPDASATEYDTDGEPLV